MFSTSEQLSRATWELCEAQMSALTSYVNATIEASMTAAEVNADAVRSSLASNTVLSRQWMGPEQAYAAYVWADPTRFVETITNLGRTGLKLEQ